MNKLRSSYEENGFLILPSLISDAEVNEIISQFQSLARKQLQIVNHLNDGELFEDLLNLYNIDYEKYIKTIKSFSRVSSIHKCFNGNEIFDLLKKLGIVNPLIPTSPVVHLISDQLRVKNGYFGQGAHQDWTSMQGSLNSLVIWVALTDVDERNFPVEVIPGSHLSGLIKGKPLNDYYQIDKDSYREEDFVPVKLKKGSAVVFSSFLVHRTGIASKGGFRIGMSYRFEDGNEKTYINRGYPTVYKRTVERTLLLEDFPTKNEVREQFGK